jgi:putative oxidoreductase
MSSTLSGYKTGTRCLRARLLRTRAPGWSLLVRLLVGLVEILCGTLVILGFFNRLVAIPLIIIMIIMVVSIISTKVPILLGHDVWIFHLPKMPRYGLRSMMHEARADFDMLLGALYLLIEGAGAWSVDALLCRYSVASLSTGRLKS